MSDLDSCDSGIDDSEMRSLPADSDTGSESSSSAKEIPCATNRSRTYYADGSIRSLSIAVGMLYDVLKKYHNNLMVS